MDFSKQYIKMCEKAQEIRKIWKPFIGDWYIWNNEVSLIGEKSFSDRTNLEPRDKRIWGGKKYNTMIAGYYQDWVLMDFRSPKPDYNLQEIIEHFQNCYISYEHCWWLPRQDQLQKIIDKNWYSCLEKFWEYITKQDWHVNIGRELYCCRTPNEMRLDYFDEFTSMEQLWLAFVMKEEYNKVWNDKDRVEGI